MNNSKDPYYGLYDFDSANPHEAKDKLLTEAELKAKYGIPEHAVLYNPQELAVTQKFEHLVAAERLSVLREKITECVRTQGVNQFTECKELRERYFKLCMDNYSGELFPPMTNPTRRTLPHVSVKPGLPEHLMK